MVRTTTLALALFAASSCAGDNSSSVPPADTASPLATVAVQTATLEEEEALPSEMVPQPTPDRVSVTPSVDLADLIRPLAPVGGIPAELPPRLVPVGLRIASVGVDTTRVRSVGVEANGEMEVPGPTEVGWYGFGPAPGQPGSAVLAAHIAADGVDGVFRHLTDADPGDRVEVVFEGGSVVPFQIIELQQYDKAELPLAELFARDGEPRLALITCGGDFNPSLRSYEDNVVAYAVPI